MKVVYILNFLTHLRLKYVTNTNRTKYVHCQNVTFVGSESS